MRRRPWRNGASWTPEEAAQELHRRRPELLGQLRRRGESQGIPPAAQDELVADAITAVVMSSRPIQNEQHLIGAFWVAVDHRARRWREGRHLTRVGSRQRVDFDTAVERAAAPGGPFEAVELTDRMARAADFMAQLDPREQRVVCVMASYGVGPVPAARLLRLPLGEVRAASRSANAKLDQVALISAAGRMCDYRHRAIAAHAAGQASASETTAARAHVNACVSCGRVYRQLRREMRGREFQRAAAAAFLPMPAVSLGHAGGLGKLAVWIEQRINFWPRGGGDRAAEALGGAGLVKAAAAGTALVVAGSALGGHLVHDITASSAPRAHRSARIERRADQSVQLATPTESVAASARASSLSATPSRQRVTVHHSSPAPPSKSDGYLALGGSSGGSSPSGSSESSSPVRATAASVAESGDTSSSEAAPQPAQSGGGASLGYLGK